MYVCINYPFFLSFFLPFFPSFYLPGYRTVPYRNIPGPVPVPPHPIIPLPGCVPIGYPGPIGSAATSLLLLTVQYIPMCLTPIHIHRRPPFTIHHPPSTIHRHHRQPRGYFVLGSLTPSPFPPSPRDQHQQQSGLCERGWTEGTTEARPDRSSS